MTDQRVAKHWIHGEWATTGVEKQSINPADGKSIGTYFDGDAETAQAAITAASIAFKAEGWRTDPMMRATALSHMADVYAARLGEVIETLCLENGKTRPEATFEATLIIRALRFAAGLALHTFGRVADTIPGRQSLSIRQPVGVSGLIIPVELPRVPGHPRTGPGAGFRLHGGYEVSGAGSPERVHCKPVDELSG